VFPTKQIFATLQTELKNDSAKMNISLCKFKSFYPVHIKPRKQVTWSQCLCEDCELRHQWNMKERHHKVSEIFMSWSIAPTSTMMFFKGSTRKSNANVMTVKSKCWQKSFYHREVFSANFFYLQITLLPIMLNFYCPFKWLPNSQWFLQCQESETDWMRLYRMMRWLWRFVKK